MAPKTFNFLPDRFLEEIVYIYSRGKNQGKTYLGDGDNGA